MTAEDKFAQLLGQGFSYVGGGYLEAGGGAGGRAGGERHGSTLGVSGPGAGGAGTAPAVPILPHTSAARKQRPIVTGVLDYFPDAITLASEIEVSEDDDIVECLLDRGSSDYRGPVSVVAFRRALNLLNLELGCPAYEDSFAKLEPFFDAYGRALAAVAEHSFAGNEKHNPGEPLRHARSKSTDQENAALRHFLERGGTDPELGTLSTAALVWRLGVLAQIELEEQGAPMARGARL